MLLVIDNLDSFTYNLVQMIAAMGWEIRVLRNNNPALLRPEIGLEYHGVIVSPGPGRPQDAGLCPEFLKNLSPHKPLLGVCLGHQLLGLLAGAQVERAEKIMHGKSSWVHHHGRGIFNGLPNPMEACRYHSLILKDPLPDHLRVIALTQEHEIMAIQWTGRPWFGVQFHPESILTPQGDGIVRNFLDICTKEVYREKSTDVPGS